MPTVWPPVGCWPRTSLPRAQPASRCQRGSFETLGTLVNAQGRAADRLGLNPLAKARLAALVTDAEVGQASLVHQLADRAATTASPPGLAVIEGNVADDDPDEPA